MAKKKQRPSNIKKKTDEKLSLGDLLNEEIRSKLKDTQKELKEMEQQKQEEELERQRRERREREKNKSFEELFEESNMKWSDYK
jgi:hypothetical protein